MAGREHAGAELLGGAEQIVELDGLVAGNARHRRLARGIAFGEGLDHRLLEAGLVVENVMRNADTLGDGAGVINILAGAAGTLAVAGGAVVVKLQGDADDVIALRLQKRRGDRGIDPTGHGDDDARVLWPAFGVETVQHGCYYRWGRRRRNAWAAAQGRQRRAQRTASLAGLSSRCRE